MQRNGLTERVAGASLGGAEGDLRVVAPELWGPGRGYLYNLDVELTEEGDLVDRYTVRFRLKESFVWLLHMLASSWAAWTMCCERGS